MIVVQGKGVSGGVTHGTLLFYKRTDVAVVKHAVSDIAAEKDRLAAAQQQSMNQLNALADACREENGAQTAFLFETHAMLVEDEDFVSCILDMQETESCCVEYAVQQAGEQFSAMFAAMEDTYMQARSADVIDVSRRLIRNLLGIPESGIHTRVPVIVAADDLAPSETVQLDKSKVLAFVTQRGSGSSHTAILARTMGIPAICALGDALLSDYDGEEVYLDGESGQMVLDPDDTYLKAFNEKEQAQQEYRELLESVKGLEDVTLDGKHVDLCCNIVSPEDLAAVLKNDGHGIGLFRSEFLYLASENYPSEGEQFLAYKSVAAAMKGKRVIIRTLDIGADKQIGYFQMPKEENPAMGTRAIRICLNRPEIFKTQLRAIYRASAFGKVAIMFPMITSVWEVKECRRICHEVMHELDAEGIAFNPETELGIMIETPASVLIAEELAQLVDFFSVGTNDLTQYTLACDRQCSDLGRFYDPHHPAVLRALKMAADAAHRAGKWIGICGELGADTSMLETFLAMGIDELSVAPASVLPLRQSLRSLDSRQCTLEFLNTFKD